MSRSPTSDAGSSEAYRAGWSAVNKLLRQGHSWSGHERNCAFLNAGDGTFANVSAFSGADFDDDGRAAARLDWDRDGDVDLFVTARTAPRLRFLRNELGGSRPSISVWLEGSAERPDPVGARLELHLDDGRPPLLRGLRAGEGFLSQSSRWIHFGLPRGASVERLVVRWPGADAQEIPGLGPGRWVVREGEEAEREEPGPAAPPLRPAAFRAPPLSGTHRVVLPAPLPLPSLPVIDAEGRPLSLFGIDPEGPRGTGTPLLLTLWASWCAPCVAELTELAARTADFREAGLALLALGADAEADLDDAAALLARVAWPHATARPTPEALDRLDALDDVLLGVEDRLGVPTSWLVDAEGRLAVVYHGRVDPDVVLADLELLDLDLEARRDAAVPFAGRWHGAPFEVDLGFYEGRLLRRGLASAARELHLGQLSGARVDASVVRYRMGRSLGEQGRYAEAIEQLLAAVEADPYLEEAWTGLGVVFFRLGRYEDAAEAYREALRLTPDSAATIYDLALVQLRLGDKEGVLAQAARLEALGDERAESLRSFAERL